MRKFTILTAVVVALTITACGSGSATTETKDSTAAQVDTAAVSATDSTVAHIEADSAAKK